MRSNTDFEEYVKKLGKEGRAKIVKRRRMAISIGTSALAIFSVIFFVGIFPRINNINDDVAVTQKEGSFFVADNVSYGVETEGTGKQQPTSSAAEMFEDMIPHNHNVNVDAMDGDNSVNGMGLAIEIIGMNCYENRVEGMDDDIDVAMTTVPDDAIEAIMKLLPQEALNDLAVVDFVNNTIRFHSGDEKPIDDELMGKLFKILKNINKND